MDIKKWSSSRIAGFGDGKNVKNNSQLKRTKPAWIEGKGAAHEDAVKRADQHNARIQASLAKLKSQVAKMVAVVEAGAKSDHELLELQEIEKRLAALVAFVGG